LTHYEDVVGLSSSLITSGVVVTEEKSKDRAIEKQFFKNLITFAS